jgi:hypothetical protein
VESFKFKQQAKKFSEARGTLDLRGRHDRKIFTAPQPISEQPLYIHKSNSDGRRVMLWLGKWKSHRRRLACFIEGSVRRV